MFRTNIDPEQKKKLMEKVRPIVAELPLKGHHKDTIETMFYSLAKAASLYHLEKHELLSVARAIKELLAAEEMFAGYRDKPKITIFGSARTPRDHEEFELAIKFGRLMKEAGYYVITGAGCGIMEAGHIGAGRENSFGLNIALPFEQKSNSVIHGDIKDFTFRYFFTRKLMFVKEACALVAFPGGYGTMDELYETLTLIQNGKSAIVPVVLLNRPGSDFWSGWDEFVEKQFIRKRLVSPNDRSLYRIYHTAEEARDEILKFYKNFHSYRYWREKKLIIRVKKFITDKQLNELSCNYSGICIEGTVHRIKKQPFFDSGNEGCKNLHYIGLNFNQKDFGSLRLLIDSINEL